MKTIVSLLLLTAFAILVSCDLSYPKLTSNNNQGTIHGIQTGGSKTLGLAATDEPGAIHTWISPTSTRVVNYEVDLKVTDFPAVPSPSWLYFFALQVNFTDFDEWAHGGIQWAGQATTEAPPNTDNKVANWGAGSSYAGYGGNGVILKCFSWNTNNWYRYRVTRLNNAGDATFTGTYYWGFWIENYSTGELFYLGSINTKSAYIKSAVVFSETGYGITNSCPKARVEWRNPNYRDEGSGGINRPSIAIAGYNNGSPILTLTNQQLIAMNPAPQWYHSTNETRTVADGSQLWNYFAPTTTTTTSTTTTTVAGSPANGTYKIVNKYSGKAQKSDSYAGSSVYNYTYTGASISQWVLSKVGTYYKIVNVATGHALRAQEYNNLNTELADSGDDELFTLNPVGNGYFKVSLKSFPNRYWKSQDSYDGNPVIIEAAGTDDKYLWKFATP